MFYLEVIRSSICQAQFSGQLVYSVADLDAFAAAALSSTCPYYFEVIKFFFYTSHESKSLRIRWNAIWRFTLQENVHNNIQIMFIPT